MFHRLGSQLVAGIPGSVDAYEVVCLNGKHWDGLCLHMYHPRRSRRLPDGYTFAPFHPVISLAMSF